jgi:two-component system response regulator PilR (NtrC family)
MQVLTSYTERIQLIRKVVAFCTALFVTGDIYLSQAPLGKIDIIYFVALYTLTIALCAGNRSRISKYNGECSLLLNSFAILLTGINESFFVVLYLPLMMLFATNTTERRILFVGTITFLAYALVSLVTNTSNITTIGIHLLGVGSGFVLVSVASRYIVEQSRAAYEALTGKVEEIRTLLSEREQLKIRLNEVESYLTVQAEFDDAKSRFDATHHEISGLTGESIVIQKVRELMFRAAPTDATVLITGPSGTGKEVVAKGIHRLSSRANENLVVVNCGAIPENLLESELFGHKKGSFTGAISDHMGLFVEAHKGTIFLDEIGELPLSLQAKLLRVLQERIVRPVGGTKDICIDVRIIAATNRNLKLEVQAGRFREDLYYRLNVIGIQLPSLLERKEDIPILVHTILAKLQKGKELPLIPVATMNRLMSYDYPGNVRELENILERALVFGDEGIFPDHVPPIKNTDALDAEMKMTDLVDVSSVSLPVNLEELIESLEKSYIDRAMKQSGGVKKKAAELLGINFRSFRYRYDKMYGSSGKDSADNLKSNNVPFQDASIE